MQLVPLWEILENNMLLLLIIMDLLNRKNCCIIVEVNTRKSARVFKDFLMKELGKRLLKTL